jgi:hypothetical protein
MQNAYKQGGTLSEGSEQVRRTQKMPSHPTSAKSTERSTVWWTARKDAVRYVFMAEELLAGPSRTGDAERADRMISRLRLEKMVG